jgi:hypothetical protein
MPLFVPSDHLTLNFSDRVRHKGKGDRWNIDLPDLPEEICKALKQKAVPFLSSIESIQDFIEMAQQRLNESTGSHSFKDPHTLQAIAYAFAYAGELQKSRDALDQLLQQLDLKVSWQQAIKERAEALKVELRDNPSTAQHQLETWETETLKNLGLDAFRRD